MENISNKELIKEFMGNEFLKLNFKKDFPLKNLTTFKIGGNARFYIKPKSVKEILEVAKISQKYKIPIFVLGNGSNLLIEDTGIDGIVLNLKENFNNIEILNKNKDTYTIKVLSGLSMIQFSNFLFKNSLTGFEFASGIPGTIGGGIYMNAGAYNGNISDNLVAVEFLDLSKNEIKPISLNKENLHFSYRKSLFSEKEIEQTRYIILSATFSFNKSDKNSIEKKIYEFTKSRKEKQPIDKFSAGSTFKRPEGFFAAKLIEDCNLKGLKMRTVEVSQKHSGFVINNSTLTKSKDMIFFIEFIKEVVKHKYKVNLEEEVKIVGKNLNF